MHMYVTCKSHWQAADAVFFCCYYYYYGSDDDDYDDAYANKCEPPTQDNMACRQQRILAVKPYQ